MGVFGEGVVGGEAGLDCSQHLHPRGLEAPPFSRRQGEAVNEWAAGGCPEAQPGSAGHRLEKGQGRAEAFSRGPGQGQGRQLLFTAPQTPPQGFQLGLGEAESPWAAKAQVTLRSLPAILQTLPY